MFTKTAAALLASASLLAVAATAHAAIAYDGFTYTSATLGGNGSSADAGWAGAWSGAPSGGYDLPITPDYIGTGLTYSKSGKPLVTTPGSLMNPTATANGGSQEDNSRALATPYGVGQSGGNTVWVSFLIDVLHNNVSGGGPSDFLALLDSSGNIQMQMGYRGSQNKIAVTGSGASYNGAAEDFNVTHLLVLEITFGAADSGTSATLNYWRDPTPGLNPAANPSSYAETSGALTIPNFTLAGVKWRLDPTGNQNSVLDELRIGDSYTAVAPLVGAPVPEPASLALLTLAAPLLLRRRKYTSYGE